MIKVFCSKFYECQYTEFSKLDQYIRGLFKDIFIAKKIYIGKPSSHVNHCLVNFVIEKQLLI